MDFKAALREPPEDLVVVQDSGIENAPDDPVGRVVTEVGRDGAVRVTRRFRGETTSFTAQAAEGLFDALVGPLVDGDFPDTPMIPFPPGPSWRIVRLRSGGEEAKAVWARRHFEGTEPFATFCRLVDAVEHQVLGPLPGLKDDVGRPLVTEVQRA